MKNRSQEQEKALQEALRSVATEWYGSSVVSFEKLLQQWQAFVAEVEAGYAMSIYDYTNALSTRDVIEEVVKRTPSHVEKILRA